MLKNVVSMKQLMDKKLLERLFLSSDKYAKLPLSEYPKPLQNLTICTIFFEPSTRTRLSFETAIQNLGGQLITVENAADYSSAKKGESLEDTIKTLQEYADGIVMRHPEIGSAKMAATVSRVPLINAGDGGGEHPTQALLDLYTIQRNQGKVDGLKVGLVGDLLNGRTVHSLTQLLSIYKVELHLIAPPSLRLPDKYKKLLTKNGAKVVEHDTWDKVLGQVDVLYMTRVQKERFKFIEDYLAIKDSFILTAPLVKTMKKNTIVMHPLPRVNEIETAVDKDPRAIYFQQVKNGLYVRMALLEYLFDN